MAWGKFIRTDGLNTLTDADLAYLASVPVATLVDFRTDQEAWRSPDKIPDSVKTVVHLPIAPGHLSPDSGKQIEEYDSPDEFMLDMYRDLALDKGITGAYRRFFARVQEKSGPPLLFHCSAGKDRTGIAAALILFTLGVEWEVILADYMASNVCLRDKYAAIIKGKPALQGLFTVKRIFLEEAFALIEAEHGSITGYLETALGVDIAAMRRRFLV